jgi:hypothetical protein
MTTLTTVLATNAGMKGLAVIIALCGVALNYWLGRRRFYRKNGAGMEGFSSYEHMRLIIFLEWIGRVIGKLLIVAGILLFLFIYISSHPPGS